MSGISRKLQLAAAGSADTEEEYPYADVQWNAHVSPAGGPDDESTWTRRIDTGIDMRGTASTDVNANFSADSWRGWQHPANIRNGIDLSASAGSSNSRGFVMHMNIQTPNGLSAAQIEGLQDDPTKMWIPSTTNGVQTSVSAVTSFNKNGYSIGIEDIINQNNRPYEGHHHHAFTFKRNISDKFLDIVRYTGNDTAYQNRAHGLGEVPGLIWLKKLGGSGNDTLVYHPASDTTWNMNNTAAPITGLTNSETMGTNGFINSVNSSVVELYPGTGNTNVNAVNSTGVEYEMYVWGGNNTQTNHYIKSGTVTINTSASPVASVTLGWTPQFVLIKNLSTTGDYLLYSDQFGFDTNSADGLNTSATAYKQAQYFKLNAAVVHAPIGGVSVGNMFIETAGDVARSIRLTKDGMTFSGGLWNNGEVIHYLAIRHPEYTYGNESGGQIWLKNTGDSTIWKTYSTENYKPADEDQNSNVYRPRTVALSTTTMESSKGQDDEIMTFNRDGFTIGNHRGHTTASSDDDDQFISISWKKKQKFFDSLKYTGDGTGSQLITHNLAAKPALIQIRALNISQNGGRCIAYIPPTGSTGAIQHGNAGTTNFTAGSYLMPSGNNTDYNLFSLSSSTKLPTPTQISVANANNIITDTTIDVAKLILDNADASTPTFTSQGDGAEEFLNTNNQVYQMDIWAYNDLTQNPDAEITCGVYGGSSAVNKFINVGFIPQMVMTRNLTVAYPFMLNREHDSLAVPRYGAGDTTHQNTFYELGNGTAKSNAANYTNITNSNTQQGFLIPFANLAHWSGQTSAYWYLAVRKNYATATVADHVFWAWKGSADDISNSYARFGKDYGAQFSSPNWKQAPDLVLARTDSTATGASDDYKMRWYMKAAGTAVTNICHKNTHFDDTGTDASFKIGGANNSHGAGSEVLTFNSQDTDDYISMWRKTTGCFDIVTYLGTGANRTLKHNLSNVPEMMIILGHSGDTTGSGASAIQATFSKPVYHVSLGNTKFVRMGLNSETDFRSDAWYQSTNSNSQTLWNATTPTGNIISLGDAKDLNYLSVYYSALLFSSKTGICKIGHWDGDGTENRTITIPGGNSNGIKWLLVKGISATGDGSSNTVSGAEADWHIIDAPHTIDGSFSLSLRDNKANYVDSSSYAGTQLTLNDGADTITLNGSPSASNTSGVRYIYMCYFHANPVTTPLEI